MPWDQDSQDLLVSMWNDGESATALADKFSRQLGMWITRNAIIGKVKRLRDAGVNMRGFRRKPPAPRPPRVKKRPSKEDEKQSKASALPVPVVEKKVHGKREAISEEAAMEKMEEAPAPVAAAGSAPVLIFDLKLSTCKFPLWPHLAVLDVDQRFYCGAIKVADETIAYCKFHQSLTTNPEAKRRLRA